MSVLGWNDNTMSSFHDFWASLLREAWTVMALSAVAMLLAPPSVGAAQADEMVPKELVEALFAGTGGHPLPQVVVGRVPEGVRNDLAWPQDARVLGSLVWPDMQLIVWASPSPADASRETFMGSLISRGWRQAKTHESSQEALSVRVRLLCAVDGAHLILTAVGVDAHSSIVKLQIHQSGNFGCH